MLELKKAMDQLLPPDEVPSLKSVYVIVGLN